jgi:hypothetical protein
MDYNYSISEIKKNVEISLGILFRKDSFLLENGVHERSISHKLAEYLQTQFPDWNVDYEYDKKGDAKKRLMGIEKCRESETTIVYPDIIIHERNKKNNLLVIEIKTKNQDPTCDIEKLKLFTSDTEYRYSFGLFIKFNGTDQPSLDWYKDGKKYEI